MTVRTSTAALAAAAWLSAAGALAAPPRAAQAATPVSPLRQRALDGCEEIVFAVRSMGGDGHWYANFGHRSTSYDAMQYGPPGGKLCRLNLRTGKVVDLLDDPGGGVRDPQVHYDGRKILFSYRKASSRYYHLYEISADPGAPGGLRQITDGPFDDLEPIYLPEPGGDIVFCSSRCNRFVQCWFTQVAILYRCRADGSDMRPISANVEQDNTPWMLPDGRLLYMRWEYVDRSRVQFHHLWTVNPDGTNVMVYFGNMHPGTVMLDAKPIPHSSKVVSIFSPGHGRKEHAGRLAIVTPNAGPDDRQTVRYVGKGSNYRDPYPLSEELMLVAEDTRLLIMDSQGQAEEVYRTAAPNMYVHEPRPLRPRPREHLIPPRVDEGQATGRLLLADVAHGRNMGGVRPGEITKLLVLETLPKPVNFSGTMEPISLGGTFTLPRILGTVPVEPDGSAYIEAPALRPLYFVALDANDVSVKRMQSFTTVMPGETTGCVGCHESRTEAGRLSPSLLALKRPPSPIEPIADVPGVMDFPRDIQPILDRHCVRCHNYKARPPADVPLVGARGGQYSHSYYALMSRGQVSHGRDAGGNHAPRAIGTAASPLMKHIDGSHHDVKLSPLEYKKVRLWIEAGAMYPGTYAALGSGMVRPSADPRVLQRRCAGCHRAVAKGGLKLKYDEELLYNLTDPAASPVLLAPLARHAGGWGLCKGETLLADASPPKQPGAPAPAPRRVKPPDPFGPTPKADGDLARLLDEIKIKRPAKDRKQARPPQAEPAPEPRGAAVPAVFESTDDADYQKLLADIHGFKERLEQTTRFDMPNFRPNQHYVREMKRYGFLPPAFDVQRDPVDVYQVDEAYWRSFWYGAGKNAK